MPGQIGRPVPALAETERRRDRAHAKAEEVEKEKTRMTAAAPATRMKERIARIKNAPSTESGWSGVPGDLVR